MPVRMWLNETHKDKQIVFEGFARTRNLAIGGTFVESTYLLPVGFPINLEMTLDEGYVLAARGEVSHKVPAGTPGGPGMGIIFTALNEDNRERLLRFFISDRIREFYDTRFAVEFPLLRNTITMKDVALIVNLWEDRDRRLTAMREANDRKPASGPSAALPAPKRKK